MNAWFRQHQSAARAALAQFAAAPASFLLNMLVVAASLILPFAGLIALDNLRPVSSNLTVQPEISVFLTIDTPREQAVLLEQSIRRAVDTVDRAGRIAFVPRERALASLKDRSSVSDALATLEANPLPDAYVVSLTPFERPADTVKAEMLAKELNKLPGVELAQIDGDWAKRLAALFQIGRLLLVLTAATLGIVVVAVIFNTIRLQVVTHREEIDLARLLGATDAFICRPFYYAGALVGLLSGILALIAVTALLQPMNRAIADFARLYGSDFAFRMPSPWILCVLLAMSCLLGLAGAVLSARRHLSDSP